MGLVFLWFIFFSKEIRKPQEIKDDCWEEVYVEF